MPDPSILVVACLAFLAAGFIKGFVGFGMPLIAIGLMTTLIALPTAMAIFLGPALAINVWQGFGGANTAALLRRYWIYFLLTMVFTWPGTLALSHVNTNYLTTLLGVLLLVYVALSMTRMRFEVPRQWEPTLNPTFGIMNGLLAGMTGAFTMPGVVYLQSTKLSRDDLVQALGLLFTLSAVGLAISMASQNLLSVELGLVAAAAILPAFAGVVVGTRLRKRTSEEKFRQFFLIALGVLGLYITGQSVLALIYPSGL